MKQRVLEVAGVDGDRRGWVAVVLSDSRLRDVRLFKRFASLCQELGEAVVIAVDIPIGLPDDGIRAADVSARQFVGARRSSVFSIPPRSALEASSYGEARDIYGSISQQAYALRDKISEVETCLAVHGRRIYEVHPEVSFRAMAGESLAFAKATWNGFHQRRRLLAECGILIPDRLEAGLAGGDDILDAAAAAWSAQRIARNESKTLPERPSETDAHGREIAIWY